MQCTNETILLIRICPVNFSNSLCIFSMPLIWSSNTLNAFPCAKSFKPLFSTPNEVMSLFSCFELVLFSLTLFSFPIPLLRLLFSTDLTVSVFPDVAPRDVPPIPPLAAASLVIPAPPVLLLLPTPLLLPAPRPLPPAPTLSNRAPIALRLLP